MKKVAIIQFPGSNCEAESATAIRRNGMRPEEFLWNRNPADLAEFDGYFLVGGFSYEDRSRAGVIASMDPVLEAIREQANLGKPVLGVCNGAQILVESGIVPGARHHRTVLSLSPNRRNADENYLGSGFYNDWCLVRKNAAADHCAFTCAITKDTILRIPFAHAEGRFLALPEMEPILEEKGLVAFQYVDQSGAVRNEFPINPNGSIFSMAAVTNASGNVMAMMPHPERTPGGDPIFASMRVYMETFSPESFVLQEIDFPREAEPLQKGEALKGSVSLPVSLIITDTTANSVQQCLHGRGYSVEVERKILWQLEGEEIPDHWESVIAESGALFNPNKEYVDRSPLQSSDSCVTLLVSADKDPVAARTLHTLHHRFHFDFIRGVHRSILWTLRFPDAKTKEEQLRAIVDSHILHSPVADRIEDVSHWEF